MRKGSSARRLVLVVAATMMMGAAPDLAWSQAQEGQNAAATGALGWMFETETREADQEVLRSVNLFAPEPGVSVTGAFRYLEHDGLDAKDYVHSDTLSFSGTEGSVFVNALVPVSTDEGGAALISPYLGIATLEIDFGKHKTPIAGEPDYNGDANSLGFLAGIRLIRSQRLANSNAYGALSLGGMVGSSESDSADNSFFGASDPSEYNYQGFNANLTVGLITALAGDVNSDQPGNIKLDVSSTTSWNVIEFDSIAISNLGVFQQTIRPELETMSSGLSAKVYSDERQADGSLLRPFAKVGLRYQFVYDNSIEFFNGSSPSEFDQSRLSGQAELGLNYITESTSYDAILYTDASDDYWNVGARLGASFKLN